MQRANKTDCVVDYHFLLAWQAEPARSGIEGREHALLGMHLTLRQRIEQSGFSSVGVTDYRDHRQALARSSFATLLAALALSFDFSFQTIDAIANATTIGFELSFTRTSASDAACQAREC